MMIEATTEWDAADPMRTVDNEERKVQTKVVFNYRDVDTIMLAAGQFDGWLFRHQLKRNPLFAESADGFNERYKFTFLQLCKPLTSKCK